MLDKNKPIRYFNDVNNLDYEYHISGAVKSAVAYVSEGSGTNQLEKVMGSMSIDDSGNKRDMSAGNNFLFDRDGNMIEDKSKEMTISYDHRGLPTEFKREVPSISGVAGEKDSVRYNDKYAKGTGKTWETLDEGSKEHYFREFTADLMQE